MKLQLKWSLMKNVSRRSKLLGLCSHPLLILNPVLTVNSVGLSLGRVLYVRLIEQLLYTKQDLFYGDGWPPILILFQNGKAHRARGIHVGMKKWRLKLAFWRWWGIIIFEKHPDLIQAAFPCSPFLSRNGTIPVHQVHRVIWIFHGDSYKTKRMVFPPRLPFLRQSVRSDARHGQSSTTAF